MLPRLFFFLACLAAFSLPVFCQSTSFPVGWIGDWKGELRWERSPGKESRIIPIELRIHPADSTNKYSWQIIYGSDSKDDRPYSLVAGDTASGHWVIDEHNGIILDHFFIGGKLCGAFTVGNSTIVNSYWMEEGKLIVEFYSMLAKPLATSGNNTEESPRVDTYRVGSWQKGVLIRL